jgi:hypothetical protein
MQRCSKYPTRCHKRETGTYCLDLEHFRGFSLPLDRQNIIPQDPGRRMADGRQDIRVNTYRCVVMSEFRDRFDLAARNRRFVLDDIR